MASRYLTRRFCTLAGVTVTGTFVSRRVEKDNGRCTTSFSCRCCPLNPELWPVGRYTGPECETVLFKSRHDNNFSIHFAAVPKISGRRCSYVETWYARMPYHIASFF